MKIFGFAGWSGSGKTTLIENLIPRFVERGITVSLIKHAHHGFDVDVPGKDSYRHRKAGAKEVLVTSGARWVLMHELRGEPEPESEDQIRKMAPCDLLLIEGWKRYPMPKIEVYRKENGKPLLYSQDEHIIAVASDVRVDTPLPQFELHDYERIARFVLSATSLG